MAALTASDAQRVQDIDYSLKALAMQMRCAITDRFQPRIVHEEIDRYRAQIAELEVKIARAQERLIDPVGRIEAIEARQAELRRERAILVSSKKVEQFLKHSAAIAELQASGYDLSELQALLTVMSAGGAAKEPTDA